MWQPKGQGLWCYIAFCNLWSERANACFYHIQMKIDCGDSTIQSWIKSSSAFHKYTLMFEFIPQTNSDYFSKKSYWTLIEQVFKTCVISTEYSWISFFYDWFNAICVCVEKKTKISNQNQYRLLDFRNSTPTAEAKSQLRRVYESHKFEKTSNVNK